jgi:hypothetical protein
LLGINRNADPVERLRTRHREFQKRMLAPVSASTEPPSLPPLLSNSGAETKKRKVLGESSHATKASRTSHAAATQSSIVASASTVEAGTSRPNGRIQVFMDPTGEEEPTEQDGARSPWEELGSRKERVKENVPDTKKMSGTTIKQPGKHQRLASASGSSKIPVFRDPASRGTTSTTETPLRASMTSLRSTADERRSVQRPQIFRDEV